MSEPKFKVGEEVLVHSIHEPHFEAIILRMKFVPNGMNLFTGIPSHNKWVYWVNDGFPYIESALRKKHKPGDSFESIMDGYKSKTGETA